MGHNFPGTWRSPPFFHDWRRRRDYQANVIALFMCIELMLHAVNLTLLPLEFLSGRFRPAVCFYRDDRRGRRSAVRTRNYHHHLPES